MKRAICVVTGTRADYGLLYWLMKEIQVDRDLCLQLIVTGTHLEERFGLTKNIILKDGFTIDREIPCHLLSDRPEDICAATGTILSLAAQALKELKPDLVVVLGDRFEAQAIAQACLIMNVPLAHLHGGEATLGLIDDGIRHSITKMAQLHFTSTEAYRRRVIQMGEHPSRVFNFGAPGLDNIRLLNFLTREELCSQLGLAFGEKSILVTYHPVTLSEEFSRREVMNLIDAFAGLSQVSIFFTMPNADPYSEFLREEIGKFVATHSNATSFVNLGQLRYLSLMRAVDAVVGNSSSGIIEAPFLGKAVVNIGMRQGGRITSSEHVLQSVSEAGEIKAAIIKVLSPEFQKRSSVPSLLQGDGNSSRKIKQKLKEAPLEGILFKKFNDVRFVE